MKENLIICIGRQFGSGGHEIGEGLAKVLGIPCYDKQILKQAAHESGIMEEMFEKADEKSSNSLLYSLSMGTIGTVGSMATFPSYNDYLTNDKLFLFQSKTIKDFADKSSCVIIGRCADYILRGRQNVLSAFIHAPLELRIQRIAKLHNIDEDAARSWIKKTDKNRANYYSFYADNDWGSADTYDLSLNSGKLGIEKCIDLLHGASEYLK